MQSAPDQLGGTRDLLEDAQTEILLSAASSWEIVIKWSLGKLGLPEPPASYVLDRMQRSAIEPLPITHGHALAVATLPHHHTDPFDRILIAQAIAERITLVTADTKFAPYEATLIQVR
jgi:PIN domain nuclease of toxin-antitoxin system